MFNPSRLKTARLRRGLTLTKLADAIGVSARLLSGYESGALLPSERTLRLLANLLDFPMSFFDGEELDVPALDGVSFRALKRMKASQRDRGLAAATLGIELSRWLDERFELPPTDVPQVDQSNLDPEAIAMMVRAEWGLGEVPLGNSIHLVEAHGIRVFSMVEDCRELDAFSFWLDGTAFIFLNTYKTAEHGRFDVAHELGHLVLHRGARLPQGREEEAQANAFASAFLMPRADVFAKAPKFPALSDIVIAKKRWNVSAAALVYRMHKIGLLSEWHYRELCIEISRVGRAREISGGEREQSQILGKAFAVLKSEGITRIAIASALHIPLEELDALVFGLALSTVKGGSAGPRAGSRANLRVVRE